MRQFFLTNTLSHRKELFVPIHPGHVGMYVFGHTVYGDAHLGHARPGVTFDVLQRLLRHLGYKVRYVRNITDVGHLEHDADEGEDKIAKKARLEQLEPMEVVQAYTLRYHDAMRQLNVAPPSIEPRASGHILEQIEAVKRIHKQRKRLLRRHQIQPGPQIRHPERPHPRRHPGRHPQPRRPAGQKGAVRLRDMEESRAGAHHEMALTLERRFPGLAP